MERARDIGLVWVERTVWNQRMVGARDIGLERMVRN